MPGLVDFSEFLHLTLTTVREVEELNNVVKKVNITSDGSTLYVHAQLRSLLKSSPTDTSTTETEGIDDARMGHIVEKLDIREGLKANFFLNLLGLSELGGEKVLVFSHHLRPLKLLERPAIKLRASNSY